VIARHFVGILSQGNRPNTLELAQALARDEQTKLDAKG
jgi:hypothetical protein